MGSSKAIADIGADATAPATISPIVTNQRQTWEINGHIGSVRREPSYLIATISEEQLDMLLDSSSRLLISDPELKQKRLEEK